MPFQTLEFFDITSATTTAWTFSDNGGYQFAIGSDTITILPGSTSQTLSVDDLTDGFFDDDALLGQTLNGGYTLNGTFYADGTIIESEYEIIVQDSGGSQYALQLVSLGNDAWNIEGFVVQGTPPPFGEALTVVGRLDGTTGTFAYATSSPACFGPEVRITLADGRSLPAARLRRGDMLRLAEGGTARLELTIHARCSDAGTVPVRLRADALGPGLPARGTVLSPQHRVRVPGLDRGLVPAVALTELGRIGRAPDQAGVTFVHLVLARHELLLAEGLPCESFWPGELAMRALPRPIAREVRRIMGKAPRRNAPFLRVQEARRLLRHLPTAARDRPLTGALAGEAPGKERVTASADMPGKAAIRAGEALAPGPGSPPPAMSALNAPPQRKAIPQTVAE